MPAKNRKPKKDRIVERNVYFYRILSEGGSDIQGAMYPFPKAVSQIASLSYAQGEHYYEDVEMGAIGCWVDKGDRYPYRLRMARIRRGDFPRVERLGRLQPLGLRDDEGLAEEVHLIVFSASLCGMLFNFYGPRMSKFSSYLTHKCPSIQNTAAFELLLRQDALVQLDKLGSLRLVDFSIRSTQADALERHDNTLGEILKAAKKLGAPERVRIVLQKEPYGRGWLGPEVKGFVRRLARWAALRESVDRFSVTGLSIESGKLESVDLLRDHLVSKQEVICEDTRTRALQTGSAYEAIERAKAQLHDEIETAATIHQGRE